MDNDQIKNMNCHQSSISKRKEKDKHRDHRNNIIHCKNYKSRLTKETKS